ncbi:helix-turn-helix transcriptional regulator [Pantoea sp. C2G6]|uniref:helix-turn-helix transcriptional regulator n=1 Tax=Pantoea sp. C2G6 TaxID=3243084 RepID=UPI003EDA83F0
MRVINTDGNPIVLNGHEICIIWFLMTGMKPKEISRFMKIKEQNISYYKRKVMRKLHVSNNFEFFSWFLNNRKVFSHERAESFILKRGEL